MKENHRYHEFSEVLASKPHLLTSWEGDIFRSTSLDYPRPADILAGEGSYLWGGRWNAKGSCRAIYGSTVDTTAVAESRAHDAYYGIAKFTKARLLVALHLKLCHVLDLTSARSRRALGVTLREIREEDWRKVNQGGHESLTQALGRAAFERSAEALLAPSAAIRGGVNLVCFPANLRKTSSLSVWDAGKLGRLTRKPPPAQ